MNSWAPLIWVGAGGCLGAIARYGLTLSFQRFSLVLPMGTLLSNCLGCFVIGCVAGLTAQSQALRPELRLFLATGFCGGFTTMSSMIYELAQLLRDHQLFHAAGYFGLTMAGCVCCFYLGTLFIKAL